MRTERAAGVTLLELLVASTVMIVALGLATSLFTSQARLNGLATAQATVRDQVSLTMQLLGSELSLVGQTVSFEPNGRVSSVAFEVCPEVALGGGGTARSCLEVTDDAAAGPIVRLAYADSLEAGVTKACRVASYRVVGTELQRANVPCAEEIEFTFLEEDYRTIVDDVVGFDIELVCSDGAELSTYPVGTATRCNPSGAYPRAIRFAVVARQGVSAQRSDFAYRPPWFEAGDPDLATCGDREVCFGLAQEFAMPNMNKDW